jgi:ATP-binding cassette subfamily B protein
LARNGLYADMWRRQQEAAAEAERKIDAEVEELPSFRAEGHLPVAE